MSEAKHTPGPWPIRRTDGGDIKSIGPITSAGEYAFDTWLDVSDEDARLIAAAPDLLEALQRARPHIGVGYSAAQRYEITKLVDAAIAKATGSPT